MLVEMHSEYHYPHYVCSMFLLPNGRLIGIPHLLAHNSMIKHAVGADLTNAMAGQIAKDAGLVSLTVNCNDLFIDRADSFSAEQLKTLENLRKYGMYKNVIDN